MRLLRAIPAGSVLRAKRLFGGLADRLVRAKRAEPLEFEQILIRYLLGAIITVYAVFSYAFESLHARTGLLIAMLLVCAWGSGLAFLIHLMCWPTRRVERRLASIIADAVALSLLLGYGEKSAAMFFPVYLWVILGNGFRYGVRYLYAAIAANLVAFLTIVLAGSYWREAWQFSSGLAIAIVIVPIYAAKLIRNLHDAMNEAEAASRAKTEFLSMMSHELRTPLTAILGLAHVSKVTAASARERFGAVSTELAAGRLLRMLDAILKFQRIEAGAVEREDKPFDMLQILDEARAITEPLAQQKGLAFLIRFTSGIPPVLRSDADHIQTIILNLVTNAVKYTAKGQVTLEIGMVRSAATPTLRIGVQDTGAGIPAEAQPRIFERFVRAQEHNASAESGVGLGLSTCKLLTELLGGRLGFESVAGRGSLFWAELPVVIEGARADDTQEQGTELAPVLSVGGAVPATGAEPFGVTELSAAELQRRLTQGNSALADTVVAAESGALTGELHAALAERMAGHGARPALVLIGTVEAAGELRPVATAPASLSKSDRVGLIATVARWHRRIAEEFQPAVPEVAPLVRRMTILVADDNELNRQVVRRMLELDHHEVLLAETGDEALQQLLDGSAELALLDVNMPGLSGIEACKAYKSGLGSGALIPVVALTADISEQTRQDCLQAGMADVLRKPVSLEQLRALIGSHEARATSADALATSGGRDRREAAPVSPSVGDERRIDALRDLFGEAGMREQFLPGFERDLVSSLETLRQAVEERRVQLIGQALHAIKSSASTAGARQICDEVDRYQAKGTAGELLAFERRIRAAFQDYCVKAFGMKRELPTGDIDRIAANH